MRLNNTLLTIGIAFLSLCCLSECSKKEEIKGKEFIPRETLVDIILDLHLIDGVTNSMDYYRVYNPGDSINMYSEIFAKYGIDTSIYNRTLKEYSQYPTLLNSVYDDVLMELDKKLDEVNDEEETSKKPKKDGLKLKSID